MSQQAQPAIRLLSEEVAQKIAAGEVVERPSSVIKELTENSIDAGSTFITVEIRDGGITYMRISDNGCGIAGEEVQLAFARHATSKLRTAQDLFNIRQMGFRGEALYSIAAVSRLEMVTKPASQPMGKRIRIEGGKVGQVEDYGCPDGTSITVTDLFFNTPARLKFLSSPATEAAAVAAIVSRLILANPHISIKLIHNQRVVYHSPGDGKIENAIYAVFGRDFASHLLTVREQWGDITIQGMLGSPEVSRSSRSQQVILVNRRPITHLPFCRLVEDAFGGALAARRYPVFVLSITLPPDQVDVNVHPNKLQVRFGDERRVRSLLQTAVSKALGLHAHSAIVIDIPQETAPQNIDLPDKGKNRTQVFQPRPTAKPISQYTPAAVAKPIVKKAGPPVEVPIKKENRLQAAEPVVLVKSAAYSDMQKTVNVPEKPVEKLPEKPLEKPAEKQPFVTTEMALHNARVALDAAILAADPTATELDMRKKFAAPAVLQQTAAIPMVAQPSQQEEVAAPPVAKVVGQVFSAYILLEGERGLYLVDQHAAHERLLYDRFRSRLEQSEVCSQPLLLPENVDLSYEEMQTLEENMELFAQLGFEIEPYGRLCYHIRAVPFILGQPQVGPFFRDVLYMLAHDKTVSGAEAKKEKLMSMACRKAIKAGDKLTEKEIDALMQIISEEDMPLTCPHGRPFILFLSKTDIDRHFKRIK